VAVIVTHYVQSMLDEGRLARGEQPAVSTGQDASWRDNKNSPRYLLGKTLHDVIIRTARGIYWARRLMTW